MKQMTKIPSPLSEEKHREKSSVIKSTGVTCLWGSCLESGSGSGAVSEEEQGADTRYEVKPPPFPAFCYPASLPLIQPPLPSSLPTPIQPPSPSSSLPSLQASPPPSSLPPSSSLPSLEASPPPSSLPTHIQPPPIPPIQLPPTPTPVTPLEE
ncbi:hypothetical protein Pcinc_008851 [Petrolisthes cinctipes]|uniref:Uncharacterized protein n=1 Tax=Petrolisthes cinctipes TaxID=88211 RepID=A0AAE1GCA8_PETCI|nr:hypothetical protein Pcinc_008851 [Petrolisthes cinctipes]